MTHSSDRHHLADQTTATLHRWLRDGTLAPGELYSVQRVAEQLGVSRSPAREAVLALAEAGLVRVSRNRGFTVVVPTGREVAEVFALRLALEPRAAEHAARRATPEQVARLEELLARMRSLQDVRAFAETDQQLHSGVLEVAGNVLVATSVNRLREVTQTIGPSTMGRTRGLDDIAEEHAPFVEAIREGDPARARLTMGHHLVTTGRLLVGQCAEAGDEDAWAAWEELVEEDL